jgi:hypothetical protein
VQSNTPWWRKREPVTDVCYWFLVPLFGRMLRIGRAVQIRAGDAGLAPLVPLRWKPNNEIAQDCDKEEAIPSEIVGQIAYPFRQWMSEGRT